MNDNRDIGSVYVIVLGHEMVGEDGGKQLRRIDRVLLGQDIDSLLLGIGCDYDRVVGFGVSACGSGLDRD